jgi:hypothetical protein
VPCLVFDSSRECLKPEWTQVLILYVELKKSTWMKVFSYIIPEAAA